MGSRPRDVLGPANYFSAVVIWIGRNGMEPPQLQQHQRQQMTRLLMMMQPQPMMMQPQRTMMLLPLMMMPLPPMMMPLPPMMMPLPPMMMPPQQMMMPPQQMMMPQPMMLLQPINNFDRIMLCSIIFYYINIHKYTSTS